MTCDKRLLLLFILLMTYLGLFVVEGRYHQHEDTSTDVRHRHRHRHESLPNRRSHHDPLTDRRSTWSQELEEYEDQFTQEREDRENKDEESDYEPRPYYERSYQRSARANYHGRMFEPRYPPRYCRGGYHVGGWYEQDNEGHRIPSRYTGRNHKFKPDRTHRRLGYTRNRDTSEYDYDQDEDELDYERSYGHRDGGSNVEKQHRAWWKNSRKHRTNSRRDWRGRINDSYRRTGKRYHTEDLEESKRFEDWQRRSNATEYKLAFSKRNDRKKHVDNDDYEYRVDSFDDTDKDDEDEDNWKEKETEDDDDDNNDDDDDDDDEELDNDFYNGEKKTPLKTYDDIIRRLTSNDATTTRSTVKRDYRNIEIEKYTKRDDLGHFRYKPKNMTQPLPRNHSKTTRNPYIATTAAYYANKKIAEDSSVKSLSGTPNDRKFTKDAIGIVVKGNDRHEKKAAMKIDDTQPKTKSLEQDYDEYLNEKDDPGHKARHDEDSGMQADVTNTDYAEDEIGDEDETPATFTTSTTTSTTSTTTTTTSTPRPAVTQHYDYRDPRAYDSATGAQYNGYQSKNDYPPMSAHSVHKWQSLGTRESVKETRSNIQQYNKNGKSAEIREALQHAIKVSREGSCQWPRPRLISVRDVYPSSSTTYIPHCVILHRCSDDTGCCRSEALTCVPKHSHRVELSFYTTNVSGSNMVEKLSFYNHTECECREKIEYDTTNEKSTEQRVYRHYQSSPQPQNMRRAPRKPCRCPSEFTPRITSEGKCQCNCFESNQNCIKTRRGKGYFSIADRLCIQNGECAMPSCEFGDYMRREGKCPRKEDKFNAIANYRTSLSHRYRS